MGPGGATSRARLWLWPFFIFFFLMTSCGFFFRFGEKEKGKRTPNLRFTENNASVLFSVVFRCRVYTHTPFQARGHSSSFLIQLLHPRFCSSHGSRPFGLSAPGWHHRKLELYSTRSALFLALARPSLARPSPPTCHSPGPQGHPKKLRRILSSSLDVVLREGLCWGAENRGRWVAARTPQASRARRDHRPSSRAAGEDVLGQVWTHPAWEVAGVRRAIPQEIMRTRRLWSSELVRNPGCKIPSWVPWARTQSAGQEEKRGGKDGSWEESFHGGLCVKPLVRTSTSLRLPTSVPWATSPCDHISQGVPGRQRPRSGTAAPGPGGEALPLPGGEERSRHCSHWSLRRRQYCKL